MAAFTTGRSWASARRNAGQPEPLPACSRPDGSVKLQGKQFYLNLVKNPPGLTRSGYPAADRGSKDVFIALNDNVADGRGLGWLWDVDFEMLGKDHRLYNRFICSGLREKWLFV